MSEINPQIHESWKTLLINEFNSAYFVRLKQFLHEEKSKYVIYPPGKYIFAAFDRTPFDEVKVVILGQDPYHGDRQAHGLSFSVQKGIKPPPSLVNIFKEIKDDLGIPIPNHGNLEKWANQGVLLLNATLTVRANQAGSHQQKGWEQFTDAVIKKISKEKEGVVFLLWGRYAQNKESLIDEEKHILLKAAHPSPLARGGFFGCKHFSKTNEYLKQMNKTAIDWSL
ncbi:MAG TPA: uracil-DNA glycosylase [Bacteroidales bacterium]|nr:MAG: uracil-DNA glycosylase [Bacteroidetes bacterium GWF2_33_38]HBF88100.1 uracil-DNA glycosylase [Bacteroidales bacterium]